MCLDTYLITNLSTGDRVVVRVNDRSNGALDIAVDIIAVDIIAVGITEQAARD